MAALLYSAVQVSGAGEAALHLAGSRAATLALARTPQCDLNIPDALGRTALHRAASRLDCGLVRLLVEAGTGLDCRDAAGNTAAATALAGEPGPGPDEAEWLVEPASRALLPALQLEPPARARLAILLFLYGRGAQDREAGRRLQPDQARRFLLDRLNHATEPEYAEIAEEAGEIVREEGAECHNSPTSPEAPADQKDEKIEKLLKRTQELEDQIFCAICLERKKNVAFGCGHSVCGECAVDIVCCHICRRPIEQKIQLYD